VAAIAILLSLVALGVLAVRFGHDSRDSMRSSEERFAMYGMAWGYQPAAPLAARVHDLSGVRRMLIVAAAVALVLFGLASIGLAGDEETGRVEAADPNTGFELGCHGTPCGWSSLTPYGMLTQASLARTGTHSAALSPTVGNTATMTSPCLQLTPGATYRLEYWYRTATLQVDHLSSFVDLWDGPRCASAISSTALEVSAAHAADEWRKVTGVVAVPANSSGAATIAFRTATSAREATVLIDDLSWAEVL